MCPLNTSWTEHVRCENHRFHLSLPTLTTQNTSENLKQTIIERDLQLFSFGSKPSSKVCGGEIKATPKIGFRRLLHHR
ncbi:hypothetical protein L1987_42646 [Smallanthus sonchifolius]|uniref:Uncharacterized protein n=1 Tax=Smallanthus sonchifolius TaxID=185202 RepID=A0ACB9GJB9_9ASTR|nr:hypothetical protein L1987_42646 [Smallanthus sonchifolius]